MADTVRLERCASVFLVHTPFQVLMAEHMARRMDVFRSRQRVLALELPSESLELDSSVWSRVIRLPVVGGSVIGRGRACRRAVAQLKAAVTEFQETEMLVSDIAWPLNNAVATTLVNGRQDGITLSIFPDGLITYLGAVVTPRIFARGLIKAALGLVGGLPYRPYWGDVTGMDWKGVWRVYTPLPELTPAPTERMILIPSLARRTGGGRPARGCVYLGQNVEHYLTGERYKRFCEGAVEFISGLGYHPVYYKPHHFESSRSRDFFRSSGLEILEDARPIERVFLERPFECVVSYNTSAFLNLKLMYGDDVRCLSYGNDYLIGFSWQDRPYGPRMRELFRRLGVETVPAREAPLLP